MRTESVGQRRWFWRLCLITVLAAIAIGVALLLLLKGSSITSLRAGVDAYHFPLTALRLGIIGLIALAWPRLIRHSEHWGYISIDRSIELASMRWRILAWLLLIEMLIGQNLIWWLLESPGGTGA